MRVVIVYESMYGNTRQVADAIATGIGDQAATEVLPIGAATDDLVGAADLLVLGAPTHGWSMSRPSTRRAAAEAAAKPASGLTVEPAATGEGMREWLSTSRRLPALVATFDTRMKAPLGLSGRASRAIARRLPRHGASTFTPSHSFFVTKKNVLLPDELGQARAWGKRLATEASGRIPAGA